MQVLPYDSCSAFHDGVLELEGLTEGETVGPSFSVDVPKSLFEANISLSKGSGVLGTVICWGRQDPVIVLRSATE